MFFVPLVQVVHRVAICRKAKYDLRVPVILRLRTQIAYTRMENLLLFLCYADKPYHKHRKQCSDSILQHKYYVQPYVYRELESSQYLDRLVCLTRWRHCRCTENFSL